MKHYPIAMTTHNREDILKRSLASLLKSDIPEDVTLYVFDDASSTSKVRLLLENFREMCGFTVEITVRPEQIGPEANMMYGLREVLDICEAGFVILLNDDLIFSKTWYKAMCSTIFKYRQSAGVVSCFNTDTHPFPYLVEDMVGVKHDMGACCTAYRRKVIDVMCEYPPPAMFDVAACNVSRTYDFLRYCTVASYVDHIGATGWNSRPHRYDVAANFIGEESEEILSLRQEAPRFDESYFVGAGVSNYTDYRKKCYGELAKDISKNLPEGVTVLDYGCATGCLVHELKRLGVDAIGTDISLWAIEQGREMFDLPPAVLQHYNRQLLTEPMGAVLCLDVLEHIPTAELWDTIKLIKSDIFVVRIPVSAKEGEDYVLDVSRQDKTHVQVHCKEWWDSLMGDYGFTTEKILDEPTIYESEGVYSRVLRRQR